MRKGRWGSLLAAGAAVVGVMGATVGLGWRPWKRVAPSGVASSASALARPSRPEWLARAWAEKERGAFDAAEALLRDEPLDAPEVVKVDAASLRGRLALARGATDQALSLLGASAARHRAREDREAAADDEAACTFVLIEQRRFDEARASLASLRNDSRAYPRGDAMADYHEGELARATGDTRAALPMLARAREKAGRAGFGRLVVMAESSRALVLVDVGRAREGAAALDLLVRDEAAHLLPCESGDLANNLGWAWLAAEEERAGASADADTRGPSEPAATAFARAAEAHASSCPDPRRRANELVNLSLAHLRSGEVLKAREALDASRSAAEHPSAAVALYQIELAARIALLDGNRDEAASGFDALVRRAQGAAARDDEARGEAGRAEIFLARGQLVLAERAAGRAEALHDEASRLVPLGEGRGAFYASRDRATRMRIEALVALGRASDALDVVRRARARLVVEVATRVEFDRLPAQRRARWEHALTSYRTTRAAISSEAEADWTLPAADLTRALAARHARDVDARATLDAEMNALSVHAERAPDPLPREAGVLTLAYSLARGQWMAFAAMNGQVAASRVPPVPAASGPNIPAQTHPIFAPFDRQIAAAHEIRVLARGALRDLDVHALFWRGRPLIDHAAVVYPSDGAALDVHRTPRRDQADALIVADPQEDLRAARGEGDGVAGALRGVFSVHLRAGSQASRDAVVRDLATTQFFHFAGHGTYEGIDGWDSALLLAKSERLAASDVLALPHIPPEVVLSGCDTARASSGDAAEGLGMASAFIAGGSITVVAAARAVKDDTSAKLMAELYRGVARGLSLQEAAREAERLLLAFPEHADAAAFRVLVP